MVVVVVTKTRNTSHKHTCPIRPIVSLLPSEHLTRRPRKTRHHIQRGVSHKEVPGPEQQRHGLRRHDGKVLWAGEVDDAEGVPEDNIGFGDVLRGVVGDPLGKTLGRFARGLRDVPACWMKLGVVVWKEGRLLVHMRKGCVEDDMIMVKG